MYTRIGYVLFSMHAGAERAAWLNRRRERKSRPAGQVGGGAKEVDGAVIKTFRGTK